MIKLKYIRLWKIKFAINKKDEENVCYEIQKFTTTISSISVHYKKLRFLFGQLSHYKYWKMILVVFFEHGMLILLILAEIRFIIDVGKKICI